MTAITLNLEGSTTVTQKAAAKQTSVLAAIMGGMSARAGVAALCADSEGNRFDGSWMLGSGNPAADMFSDANAQVTGITLAFDGSIAAGAGTIWRATLPFSPGVAVAAASGSELFTGASACH